MPQQIDLFQQFSRFELIMRGEQFHLVDRDSCNSWGIIGPFDTSESAERFAYCAVDFKEGRRATVPAWPN